MTTTIDLPDRTVDLTTLVGTLGQLPDPERAHWVAPASITQVHIGQIAYVHSYGDYRRGVVTKIGRLKVTVTFTTAGAIEQHNRWRGEIKVTAKAESLPYLRIRVPAA